MNSRENKINYLYIMVMVLLVSQLFVIWELNKFNSADDDAQHYWNNTFQNEVSGLYVPSCGFWVDTRGELLDDINNTVHHEYLHSLIHQDNESRTHFCGEE